MRVNVYLIVPLLMLMVSFSGCIQKESGAQTVSERYAGYANSERSSFGELDSEVKIGVIQSLTGDLGEYGGVPMTDAIKLAAKEVNANGGVLNKQIKLLIEDDQTLSVAAIDAANKLVKKDNVPVIIGATGSGQSIAIIDITTKKGVLQISPSNTGVEFTTYNDSDLYFRTALSDSLQGVAMAKLAAQNGYKTASTLVINNPYGRGFEEVFVKAFEAEGGRVLESVRYDPTQTIFESEVDEVSKVKPDFVMLVSYPETSSQILRTAYQKSYLKDTHWLMSEGIMVEGLVDMVGKDPSGKFILAGFQGVAPEQRTDSAAYLAFRDKFVKEYGKDPTIYCSNSYDAMAVIALAMEEAGSTKGTAIRDHLRSVANPPGIEVSDIGIALKLIREGNKINYQGSSGNITFDDNGDVNGTYSVWYVADNGIILEREEIDI